MNIEISHMEGAPACCHTVAIDGGDRWCDRGVWCQKSSKLVLDGRVVALCASEGEVRSSINRSRLSDPP